MSAPITKVALAGATGNVGPNILQALLDANFTVTVLTRQSTDAKFPPEVKVARVDYDSLDSLTHALQGQDAVVSTLASTALDKQLLLVDAATKAGVKRFLPSEFGSNTSHPKTSQLPSYGHKIAVQEALKRKEADGMTWTLVHNGALFDWGIMVGFLVNLKGKQINLWDGGNRIFSTTTLATVGRAVAGVLKHPEETENRAVFVHDTAISQKRLAELGKRAVGSKGWKEDVVSVDDLIASAWADLKRPDSTPHDWAMKFITAAIWGEDYGAYFDKTDNKLLGIKEMNDDEIQAVINRFVCEST